MKRREVLWITAGLLFSIFWASASTATKAALTVSQPMVIAIVRFALASCIMILYAHLVKRHRLPRGSEWLGIAIYGLLNITIYLGCYVFAMQEVTAGIGAIATATNPVFISLMSVIFLNRRFGSNVLISLVVCMAGVVCASWPLLQYASVTPRGLFILFFSMISYSLGAIYVSSKGWKGLSLITINAWQTLIGGILLLPLAMYHYKESENTYNFTFWGTVLWLSVPVSIFAAQFWLWLLKINPVKSGFWLFLCPLFGAFIAAAFLGEPITVYTLVGISMVIAGLLWAKKENL